jgi:hypothetical protein
MVADAQDALLWFLGIAAFIIGHCQVGFAHSRRLRELSFANEAG